MPDVIQTVSELEGLYQKKCSLIQSLIKSEKAMLIAESDKIETVILCYTGIDASILKSYS